LVEQDHFRLDKLLNRTEQDLQAIEKEKKELQQLVKENEKMKKEMEVLMDKEKHTQQVELLKHNNRITEDRLAYLKDMERKLKQIVFDWKKAESSDDKKELIKQIKDLLFHQQVKQKDEKIRKKINSKYEVVGGEIRIGQKVLMKKNHQVGEVKEIKGKKAVVQLGMMPITVEIGDLTVVEEK
jgi:DNA mismatch repair protein MutS2